MAGEGKIDDALEKFIQSFGHKVESLSKIKLKGGIVGKMILLLMVFAISAASISWAVKDVWLGRITVVLTFALIAYLTPKLIKFATENPQAALLEGAEFTVHKLFEQMGMKAKPDLKVDPTESTPEPVAHPQLDVPEIVERPDAELENVLPTGLDAPDREAGPPPDAPADSPGRTLEHPGIEETEGGRRKQPRRAKKED